MQKEKWWEVEETGEDPERGFSAKDEPGIVFGVFALVVGVITWLTLQFGE